VMRTIRIGAFLALVAILAAGVGTVAAGSGDGKILDTTLVGLPAPGTVIAGVTGAGHAWAVGDSSVKLFADGRVRVRVEGLVLTPENTNPVASGRIVVSCNGGAGGVQSGNVVQSDVIPLSIPDGNAEFNGSLSLPSSCMAPTVFFTSPGGAWFAVSGF
jgi:hypothetical protein